MKKEEIEIIYVRDDDEIYRVGRIFKQLYAKSKKIGKKQCQHSIKRYSSLALFVLAKLKEKYINFIIQQNLKIAISGILLI